MAKVFLVLLVFILGLITITSPQKPHGFIIAHSHCDPGWLLTYKQYYDTQVSKIITNVISQLLVDSNKKFIWSEISYFQMWWDEQNDEMKEKVRDLVTRGQLEFVNGGWVMADEATTSYVDVINQITEGHVFLKNELETVPKIAWQIDPFGASKVFPSLFKMMGFEYHVANRIDDRLKYVYENITGSGKFRELKHFEFFWKGSKTYGEQTKMFVHVLSHHYSPPEYCYYDASKDDYVCTGFDFEENPTRNPPITDENIKERAGLFANLTKQRAGFFRTNNVMIPFGNDFRFLDAEKMFSNMDKLIAEINSNSDFYGITLSYSTPSEYFEAVKNETERKGVTFPTKEHNSGDFFPYTNCWFSELKLYNTCVAYWSGYYTSYPNFKLLVRKSSAFLRAVEILHVLMHTEHKSRLDGETWEKLFEKLEYFRRQIALMQHHDGITGTSKKSVRDDYTQLLYNGSTYGEEIATKMLGLKISKHGEPDLQLLPQKLVLPAHTVPVILFNSLGWSRKEYVSIDVDTKDISVCDTSNCTTPFEIVTNMDGTYTLYVVAQVQPLGYETFYIVPWANATKIPGKPDVPTGNTVVLENSILEVTFESPTSKPPYFLKSIRNKRTDKHVNIEQQMMHYTGLGGGAYIMLHRAEAVPISITGEVKASYHKGKYIQELSQKFETFTQTWRVYNDLSDPELGYAIELETRVHAGPDKEVITRFTTPIETKGKFYTDENGLEMVERKYEIRYEDDRISSKIAGNYYPMTRTTYIRDQDTQLTIMSMQALGTSSQYNGSLEVMLQRNTLQDDGRGVGENLNDTEIAYVPLKILLASPETSESLRNRIQMRFEYPFVKFIANAAQEFQKIPLEKQIDHWRDNFNTFFTPLSGEFPRNIHLLTLSAMDDNVQSALLRLNHMYELGQDTSFSTPTSVHLASLFANYTFENMKETSLTGVEEKSTEGEYPVVNLNPLQIMTFTLSVKMKVNPSWFNFDVFLIGVGAMAGVCLLGLIAYFIYNRIGGKEDEDDEGYENLSE